jgi:hydrogenase nickel incorporation protein HypB
MCVVCGCSDTGARVDAAPAWAGTDRQQDVHFGLGEARVSVPGMSQTRAIQIEQNVLSANNSVAAANRARFAAHGVTAFNLVSSPGSGKTTLLCATSSAARQRRQAGRWR